MNENSLNELAQWLHEELVEMVLKTLEINDFIASPFSLTLQYKQVVGKPPFA